MRLASLCNFQASDVGVFAEIVNANLQSSSDDATLIKTILAAASPIHEFISIDDKRLVCMPVPLHMVEIGDSSLCDAAFRLLQSRSKFQIILVIQNETKDCK